MTAPVAAHRFALLFGLSVLVASPAPSLAAWPHDEFVGNLPISTGPNHEVHPLAIEDGEGGFIVAYVDSGPANQQRLFARRVTAGGQVAWAAGGVPLRLAGGRQREHRIVADGAGGAIVAWRDSAGGDDGNVIAQRVSAAGAVLWGADGVVVCSASGIQFQVAVAADGSGGAIFTWTDLRGSDWNIFAQRVTAAGAVAWTPNGVPVCSASQDQGEPAICPDGAGGATIAWSDARTISPIRVFVQRVAPTGEMLWNANGLEIGPGYAPHIARDGAGGFVLAWAHTAGFYGTRLTAAGLNLLDMGGGGATLCSVPMNFGTVLGIATDGAGGAHVVWKYDGVLVVDHLYANGLVEGCSPSLTSNAQPIGISVTPDGDSGVLVAWAEVFFGTHPDVGVTRTGGPGGWSAAATLAVLSQETPSAVADGMGGALVVWSDRRGGAADLYAQRIAPFGRLGNPEPAIAGVRDIPNDQGGKVRLSWDASYLDVSPTPSIESYWVWRQVPAVAAHEALRSGAIAMRVGLDPTSSGRRVLEAVAEGTTTVYWEFVASQIAAGDAGYSMVVATTGDSMPGSNPFTLFRVQARHVDGESFWSSATDSGYSVDNLAPAAPAAFLGRYASGTTVLHWLPNAEPDLAGYRLHRGEAPEFAIDESNLVATLPDTGYTDAAGAPFVYKLVAVDAHGNVSAAAIFSPGVVAVEPAAGTGGLSLGPATPNPASGRAAFRLDLPAARHVQLEVFDESGRRIRALPVGALAAGSHVVRWDLRSDRGGHVPSGIYFLRLRSGDTTLRRRFAVLR